jgi:predicted ester cyclase
MSTQYKTAVLKLVEKGFNRKEMSAFNAYFSPTLIDHALPPGLPAGLEGRKIFVSTFLSAFPDIHVHVEDTVADGNKLVTRWSARGTHNGDLMGIPPTGKKVSITGIAIDRFENGRSQEHWEIIDELSLMQQLDVIPMPG